MGQQACIWRRKRSKQFNDTCIVSVKNVYNNGFKIQFVIDNRPSQYFKSQITFRRSSLYVAYNITIQLGKRQIKNVVIKHKIAPNIRIWRISRRLFDRFIFASAATVDSFFDGSSDLFSVELELVVVGIMTEIPEAPMPDVSFPENYFKIDKINPERKVVWMLI